MKIASTLTLVFISFQIISCSNCKETANNMEQEKNKTEKLPTSIVQNLSIVTARVEEVLYKSETDFQIKATVLVVKGNDAYNSIATPGQEYLLTPNFRYDNEVLMKSDVNDALKNIGKLSKGKEFKAEISLENGKGWFIQKVLND
jgi:hypothetical protein